MKSPSKPRGRRPKKKGPHLKTRLEHARFTRKREYLATGAYKLCVLVNLDTNRSRTVIHHSPIAYGAIYSLATESPWCPRIILSGLSEEQAIEFLEELESIHKSHLCVDKCLSLYRNNYQEFGLGIWFTGSRLMKSRWIHWTKNGCNRGHLLICENNTK